VLAAAQEEFEALCFDFGIELDDVVSRSDLCPYCLSCSRALVFWGFLI
jgi:hypothetical protein